MSSFIHRQSSKKGRIKKKRIRTAQIRVEKEDFFVFQMEEGTMPENHLTSAAAFVEGGAQEACDDACSICLEAFCDSDPSTLTSCKHEFHLQCILEWCQRSSQCPMCWQPISFKDPGSQELLDAVEHERNIQTNLSRNTTIFHHPTLGDFELQHLPVSASDSELEERIIQHLAAAAAMGRARHFARREGHRIRSSAHGRPHFLVFSTDPTASSAAASSSPAVIITSPNSPLVTIGEDSTALASSADAYQQGTRTSSVNRTSPSGSSPSSQDRAGPSDFQVFSESLKSRLSALSTRYKESITKSTRGWKDRLFARNSSTPSTEIRREANLSGPTPIPTGIGCVSHMMDHLEITPASRTNAATSTASSTPNPTNRDTTVGPACPSSSAAATASSASG